MFRVAHRKFALVADCCLLTLVLGALLAFASGSYPLQVPDEARYSEIGREMLVSGDYVTPRMNAVKYFEKPPLFYWLQAAAIAVAGVHEKVLRFWPWCFAMFGVWATYLSGRRFFERNTALLAAVMLATSTMYFLLAHASTLDLLLSVCLSACLFSFVFFVLAVRAQQRTWPSLLLFYSSAAAAVMSKGLIGLLLPVLIIGAWMMLTQSAFLLQRLHLLAGGAWFCLLVLPWHVLAQWHNPEFFHFYIVEQHFLRYLTDSAQRQQPIGFFLPVLFLGFFPWSFFLPRMLISLLTRSKRQQKLVRRMQATTASSVAKPALIGVTKLVIFVRRVLLYLAVLRKKSQQQPIVAYLLLWTVLVFLFFSCSQSKLIPYILPLFPPLALLTARFCVQQGVYLACWRAELIAFALLCLLLLLATVAVYMLSAEVVSLLSAWLFFGLLLGLTVILVVCYRLLVQQASRQWQLATMLATQLLLLLTFMLSWPHIEQRSIKTLALTYQKVATAESDLIVYEGFYFDLPLYLQEIVTVVGPLRGELRWGASKEALANIITEEDFFRRWSMPKPLFVISDKKKYAHGFCQRTADCQLIATSKRYVLFSNQELS